VCAVIRHSVNAAEFGKTNQGRFLSVFFVYTVDKQAIIVSARDMSDKERKIYHAN